MRSISLSSTKALWDKTLFPLTRATPQNHYPHKYQHQQGFTLTELLITIAIAGIVLAIALPSLNNFIVKMRIDNQVSQLNRLVLTARNTAINTEQNVTLCPLTANNTCSNNWQNELSIFIDLDNDGVYEPGLPAIPPVPSESIVQVKSATTSGDTITYAGQNRVSFLPTGALSSIPSTFIYCPASDATLARAIVLSLSGRSYMSADLNGDGRDQDRDQSNISCD
ncbi:GspH/FimT family pseudopilin [Colwellia ponticola]|uniref:Type II secretion system protein H n=1 Tax=Colwellia ponticola TaxID=2304625 RepID=A0A8H2PM54_9GAMM|nr:GspH/FimT family pseudopilin [Colwellia ponticola]TMM45922.1 prepilin-type N-terminal cleavage/methylation domain-containing protein [Colwellia ponticola]